MGHTLTMTAPCDTALAMTRVFDAPRARVFDCLTQPDLLRRWLLGPPDWTMTVCEVELAVGGAYRYVWRHDGDGTEMGLGGFYREVAPPERIVASELFDEPWYPGEALVTIAFAEQGGKTTMTTTVRYASKEARDIALASPMEQGVAASYDRLDGVLASL